MYSLIYLQRKKIIFQKDFEELEDAEEFVDLETHEFNYKYQIIDIENDEIVTEDYLLTNEMIIEETMDMMFPDDESEEGFDVDDFCGGGDDEK
jgi:hypothetical protein